MIRIALRLFAQAAIAASLVAIAQAADVNITDAKIAGGKLVITGTTTVPNSWVRLDGQTDSDFNVKSGADGAFTFGIVYHPGDCIVDLQRLNAPGNLGAASEALVADCGPAGVTPRGPWSRTAGYVANDLATFEGSTWRARRSNAGKAPIAGADWELFAAGAGVTEASTEGGVTPMTAPTGPAGGDLTGNYPDPVVKQGGIGPGKIAALAVITGKIADGAVTAAKIGSGAVTSAAILDEFITSADLATDSVNASEIADNSIDGGEIVDNSLFANDLGTDSVGASELADNSVASANVVNNSLTAFDLAGGKSNGSISLGAGYVANGACRDGSISVGGAQVGDAVLFSINGSVPAGILIYGVRVPSAGTVTVKVCNFSGSTMAAISNLPVAVITITI